MEGASRKDEGFREGAPHVNRGGGTGKRRGPGGGRTPGPGAKKPQRIHHTTGAHGNNAHRGTLTRPHRTTDLRVPGPKTQKGAATPKGEAGGGGRLTTTGAGTENDPGRGGPGEDGKRGDFGGILDGQTPGRF